MTEIFAHILAGIGIAIALVALLIPDKALGRKISLVAAALSGLCVLAPSIGLFAWGITLIALVIAALVDFVRGFRNIHW